MIGAIIGILLGLTSYYMPLPFVPPIIGAGLGAALGANAIIQERRGEVRNKTQLIAGIAATIIGGLVAVLALVPIQYDLVGLFDQRSYLLPALAPPGHWT